MNQYTDEIILNSDCWTDLSTAAKALRIKGIANFRVDSDITYTASKHVGADGTADKAELTVAETRTDTSWQTDGIYRLWVELGEREDHQAEYQNSLTRENKVIAIEVKADTAALAATALKKALEKQNRDSKNPKLTVSVSGAVLTLTAVDDYIVIKKCELQALTVDAAETLTGYDHYEVLVECEHVATAPSSGSDYILDGKAPFGTAEWIVRNLRMPTLANTSWTAIVKDNGRPVPGKVYDEYAIVMTAKRGELTGMGAVGQELTSVTRHIFFVEQSLDFEAAIKTYLGLTTVEDVDA